MYQNFINKMNINKYVKIIKDINKQYEVVKSLENPNISILLKELKENTKLKNKEKTIKTLAYAKYASQTVLGMTYYDVQLMGALGLVDGSMAEMKTGEGKTLTCSAAVAVNYVLGYSTHVATANDYLAKRDQETLKPLYDYMGISSSFNISGLTREQKIECYHSDVVYSTAQEFGFDFLRDNLIYNIKDKIQPIGFDNLKCIIDEADFVLIDEARTPLIISGESPTKEASIYYQIKDIVVNLKKSSHDPNKPLSRFDEKEIDGDFIVDEKQKNIYLTDKGYENLESNFIRDIDDNNSSLYHDNNSWFINEAVNALKAKYLFVKDKDYIVKNDEIIIVDPNTGRLSTGRTWSNGLHQAVEAKENLNIHPENATLGSISIQNYFRNYKQISGMSGTILQSTEEFEEIYNCKTVKIPTNKPVIRKEYQDKIYITTEAKYTAILKDILNRHQKGQPILVGTTSVAESEIISQLLDSAKIKHYVLNAKNHALEAQIIAQAGEPGRVTVATSMAGRGTDIILGGNKETIHDMLYQQLSQINERIGFANLVTSEIELEESLEIKLSPLEIVKLDIFGNQNLINELYKEEQFINIIKEQTSLIWTTLYQIQDSVERQIEILNTQWSKWKQEVINSGGLCVIGSSRNESRRIDDQLRGRSARQGDPGESIFYMSLQDPWVNVFGKNAIFSQLIKTLPADEAISSPTITKIFAKAQKSIEAYHFDVRKNTYQYDTVADEGRQKFISIRNNILFNEGSIKEIISQQLLEDLSIVTNDNFLHYLEDKYNKVITVDEIFEKPLNEIYSLIDEFTNHESSLYQPSPSKIDNYLIQQKIELILLKQSSSTWEYLQNSFLKQLDNNWSNHLDFIEEAQKNVAFRAVAQKNPIYEYKKICFQSFSDMLNNLRGKVINEFVSKTI